MIHFVRICRPSVESSKLSLSQSVDSNIDRKKKNLNWILRGSSKSGGTEIIHITVFHGIELSGGGEEAMQMYSATKTHIRKMLKELPSWFNGNVSD